MRERGALVGLVREVKLEAPEGRSDFCDPGSNRQTQDLDKDMGLPQTHGEKANFHLLKTICYFPLLVLKGNYHVY